MTAGLEGLTVSRWVYETLTGDPELQDLAGSEAALKGRVAEGPGTTNAPWWVRFTILDPVDVKVANLAQVMSMVQFQVVATCPGDSYSPIQPVYRRVHQLLESQRNQEVLDGAVLTCHRVSGVQFPEQVNGIHYRHLGGLYQTNAQ